ncbi:hypothetical protein SDC9_13198 [bioreactor metagenome]|uniref:Diguanylate cyclase (GGDEF) domain protein n=2 Tax=root TaxID=1 RepID=A0A098AVE7_DESHA|nr:GGDEF domain-containing protein [Desulfitobacterium hafniense]CDX00057.1 Diguanylate cyclase (GGDEF) domain protein [Desulfitobacterium hafniense]
MMPLIVHYVELNFFAMTILCVIFLNMRRPDRQYSLDQKLFFLLISANILLLLLDSMLWILDGKPGSLAKTLSIASIIAYNTLNPVICMIWYYYVDFYIHSSKERLTKVLFPILLPVLINLVLSVASVFTNIYFIFDENNVYHRGRFIFLLLGICLYMIIYTSAFLIRNRKKIAGKEYAYLLFFAIPPMVGGIIQFMFPGAVMIWIASTLSILIIFINIQKDQLNTDYLTGVYNRRYLDNYLQEKMKNRRHHLIAGIMIDIDSFKTINDSYGHDNGDQALKYTAQMLRKTFRKTDFIARYGGDEFVIVMEIDDRAELMAMVQRLKEKVSQFNLEKITPYEIRLSIGYDCYTKEPDMSTMAFLKRIDQLMYIDKQKNV